MCTHELVLFHAPQHTHAPLSFLFHYNFCFGWRPWVLTFVVLTLMWGELLSKPCCRGEKQNVFPSEKKTKKQQKPQCLWNQIYFKLFIQQLKRIVFSKLTQTYHIKIVQRAQNNNSSCWCLFGKMWASLEVCGSWQSCTDSSKCLRCLDNIAGKHQPLLRHKVLEGHISNCGYHLPAAALIKLFMSERESILQQKNQTKQHLVSIKTTHRMWLHGRFFFFLPLPPQLLRHSELGTISAFVAVFLLLLLMMFFVPFVSRISLR